ncbi:hypothetical protein OAH33_00395 [bacterium]|nr:hypothetical protein [bacterium]
MSLRNFVVYFVFIFAGFTGVFRYGDWFPLYQYGVLIAFLFSWAYNWSFNREDYLLIICFSILFFTSLLNFNDKTLNYMLAYFYTFFILYKNLDNISRMMSLNKLLKFNALGIFISSFYSCIEFLTKIFLNIKIQDYLPRVKEATATYMAGVDRSYGFATEPTSLAIYLNILGPFAVLYWKNNLSRFNYRLFTLVLVLGWSFTFSASAVLFLGISVIGVLTYVYRLRITKIILRHKKIVGSLLMIIGYGITSGFLNKIMGKIFLTDGGTSATQRFMVYELAINRFFENPITGIGLGYTSSVNEMSPINWYLMILSNGGIFAFLFSLIYMVLTVKKSLQVRKTFSLLPAIGISAGTLGFLTTSTFYNPFFWLAVILLNRMSQIHDKNTRRI